MRIALWQKVKNNGPLIFVVASAAAVFLILSVYAFAADFRELACNRLQDDSYYYLLPAWNLPRLGFFTFDGEHPTYGFQPLWMLVLSLFSSFSPDKEFFLRISVALGGLFFSLTALPLYFLCRRWLSGWRAILGPVLWTVNATLAGIFITGKENALYAFLLILSCVLILRRMNAPARGAWAEGIVLGLTVLARVNALVPVLLLLGVLFWKGGGLRAERVQRVLAAGAGLLAVLIPWCVYAQIAFGAIFPNSGSAKLIDSAAALAVFAQRALPWIPAEFLHSLVPVSQQAFLAQPDLLILPTRSLAITYLIGWIPDLAYGSWAGLFSFLGVPDFRLKVFLLGLIGLTGVGWILLELRGSSPEPTAVQRRAGAAVLAVLLASAAINSVSNWLLMPGYLLWGVWYTVPEMAALVLALVTVIGLPLEWLAEHQRRAAAQWIGIILITLLTALGLLQFIQTWMPREYIVAPDGTQDQEYQAAEWMNRNLPSGSRVGSFSAGLLGYFAETYRVINLDGLANTPAFVDEELTDHVLFVRGLSAEDPLREYLRREQIAYLANVDPVDRIQRGDYLGLLDPGGGILLYQGGYPIFWGSGEPEQHMIVVQIKP